MIKKRCRPVLLSLRRLQCAVQLDLLRRGRLLLDRYQYHLLVLYLLEQSLYGSLFVGRRDCVKPH